MFGPGPLAISETHKYNMRMKEILEAIAYHPQVGESPIVHHASTRNIVNFFPFSHFGTANAARGRAAQIAGYEFNKRTKNHSICTLRD